MMSAVEVGVIGGVDTHGDVHVAAAVDSVTGRALGSASFPTTASGDAELVAWLKGLGALERVGVEATGSYGAGLSRYLSSQGVEVIEVDRPDRKARRFEGKSDAVDAEAAARAVLSGRAHATPKTRDGMVEAIRALEVVYHGTVKDRTRAINQFKALVVSAPERLRGQLRGLGLARQLAKARRFSLAGVDVVEEETRRALKELARTISFLDDQASRLEARLGQLAGQAAPALVGLFGVGPHVAARVLAAAGDNPGRMRSEAAFAKLCGACPIPAGSGKTNGRHRLNRGGDRRANNALYTVVLVRMRYHGPTRAYVARRTAEGKSRPEIIRCLKRFVARDLFQAIVNPPKDLPSGHELRQRRLQAGRSLTEVSAALGTAPITISRLERGLLYDTRLARQQLDWLVKKEP